MTETEGDTQRTIARLTAQAQRAFRENRWPEALALYQRVLALQEDNIQALFAASWLFLRTGRPEQAAKGYERIIALQPGNAEAWNSLGAVYHEYGGLPQAVRCYQKAIQLKPDMADAHNNLGGAFQRLYLMDEAAASYKRALMIEATDNPVGELRIASLCRPVARSQAESEQYRRDLLQKLDALEKSGFRASPQQLVQTGPYPSYSLMYHGLDDRPIREAYARVFQPCFPHPQHMGASGKRKIGMVVTKTHEKLFVRSMGGVLRHIDKALFEITVVCIQGREQELAHALSCPDVRMLTVPENIDEIARRLQKEHFDILYYWEVATDPLNYFLPFYRLAPIQCTSWGIQVTSGIPTMDYYLSSTLVEPDDARRHYSEKLISANTLLTYQYRSSLPANAKRREDFGLPRDKHIYLFPQQMGKFHPEFDQVTREILRRDPRGILVILQGLWPYTAEQLRGRLQGSMPDVVERVIFLPRLDHGELLSLIADSEVLLDPPYYGGVNSSYDGFSVGTPIVTRESGFHIGRYTAACYRKMGLADCIAHDDAQYIEMALELGTRPDFRKAFSERIRNASHLLYEDMGAVREHERIFCELLDTLPA